MCHSVSACCKRAPSLGAALLVAVTIWSWATIVPAQQTITTAVNGPILGNNNSITITASGSVTPAEFSVGIALNTTTGDTITTLNTSGTINGLIRQGVGGLGLFNDGQTIDSITNSGTWDGEVAALRNTGTVTSLTNAAAGRLRGTKSGSKAIDNLGTITTLTNSGLLQGPTAISTSGTIGSLSNLAGGEIGKEDFGITVASGGLISSLSNAGSISATSAITNDGTITSLVNSASIDGSDYAISGSGILGTLTNTGTIQGTTSGVRYLGSLVSGTLANNAGATIQAGSSEGVRIESTLGRLQNAGRIRGGTGTGMRAVGVAGTLNTLDNSGLIDGSDIGVQTTGSGSIVSLVNSGTISGLLLGVQLQGGSTMTTLENKAGGVIVSTFDDGLRNNGTLTTLVNAGSITGVRGINNSYTIGTILNTGTIKSVTNNQTIGGGVGTTAISSTGTGASIGELYNNGNVSGDVLITGQDFNVYSSFGGASLKNGTITVSDGSLNLMAGNTFLDSNVLVHSALNNYANATLTLEHQRSLTGNFVQASSATLTTSFDTATDFGRLDISGNATLAGLLNIDDPNSALTAGTYTLLTFANRSGTFSGLKYEGLALTSAGTNLWTDGSWLFRENYYINSMSLTVSAVPEPSTIAMGALGIVGARLLQVRAKRRKLARRR